MSFHIWLTFRPMSADDDLDHERTVRMTGCWVCGWKCGQRRNEKTDRCTGLYHGLVDRLNAMYPPGDMYLVDPREDVFGSFAIDGPIVADNGTVWHPDWNGHPVSFVQSALVMERDQQRERGSRGSPAESSANPADATPSKAQQHRSTNSETTEDAETTEERAQRLLDFLRRN